MREGGEEEERASTHLLPCALTHVSPNMSAIHPILCQVYHIKFVPLEWSITGHRHDQKGYVKVCRHLHPLFLSLSLRACNTTVFMCVCGHPCSLSV